MPDEEEAMEDKLYPSINVLVKNVGYRDSTSWQVTFNTGRQDVTIIMHRDKAMRWVPLIGQGVELVTLK